MRHPFLILFFLALATAVRAQTDAILHEGSFKTIKIAMSSRTYKPDDWEAPLLKRSVTTAFPSDLLRDSARYKGQLIHLIGIGDSVYQLSPGMVALRLDNHYWDYIEDYSIQDEVMFISAKGDGKFIVVLPGDSAEFARLTRLTASKALFMVYGLAGGVADHLPILSAVQLKYYDLFWYSTKIFSYTVKRNTAGEVEKGNNSFPATDNFKFLQVAKRGQNK